MDFRGAVAVVVAALIFSGFDHAERERETGVDAREANTHARSTCVMEHITK